MRQKTQLHIIVPGLCGPLSEVPSPKQNPALARWLNILSRSNMQAKDDSLYGVLNDVFSLGLPDADIDAVFPSARFTLAADSPATDLPAQVECYYMHADPVYLRADIDHAVLGSSDDFELSEEEAKGFCDVLNRHFRADGLRFFYTQCKHWFVESDRPIALRTTPLRHAVARNINLLLPEGEDATRWKQVLNESQMLLFSCELNAQREQRGQPPVNSLWFHGAGQLPSARESAGELSQAMTITTACGQDRLLQGIARYTGTDFFPLPDNVDAYIRLLSARPKGGQHVLHLSELAHCANYTDIAIWLGTLEKLLQYWLYPLIAWAAKNRAVLMLYSCDGRRYRFDGFEQYRFWRRGGVAEHIGAFGAVNNK